MSAAWRWTNQGGLGSSPETMANEFGAKPTIAVRAHNRAIPEKNQRSTKAGLRSFAAIAKPISDVSAFGITLPWLSMETN